MRARWMGLALITAGAIVAGTPAPAGAVTPAPPGALGVTGKWYGVFTHYRMPFQHGWTAFTDPLADGINVHFTVAPDPKAPAGSNRIVIKRLTVKPKMWQCQNRKTSIRFAPVLRNIKVSDTGAIPQTLKAPRILHPVLRPKVRLHGWKPRAIVFVDGRFSADRFADGTMFLAVGGCASFVQLVWIAAAPTPEEVPQLTSPPPADEIPTDPSQSDSDGENWIGCHLVYCTPYTMPPFDPPANYIGSLGGMFPDLG